MDILGATLEPLSERELRSLGIGTGLRVTAVKPGKFQKVGIREGFILTSVNKTPVRSVKDVAEILKNADGGVIIEGLDRNGARSYYAFGM